jgi:cell division septum initiation protein DivIVA
MSKTGNDALAEIARKYAPEQIDALGDQFTERLRALLAENHQLRTHVINLQNVLLHELAKRT